MPVNFQEIYQRIREIGAGASERKKTLEERRAKARDLLNHYANELDYLKRIVEIVKEADPNIRCALPINESLASHVPKLGTVKDVTLIAADGSQINPDRHASVQFCLVNVGAISMCLNSQETPLIYTDSELLYGEDLDTTTGTMTEGMLALRRDLNERAKLEELSREIEGPVVTFTDGPLELWGARDGEEASVYRDSLEKYRSVLSRLQENDVITAGYVDKPGANLVLRLLELILAQREEKKNYRDYYPLRGVTDRWLYGEKTNPLLGPGERSAVFAIQSRSGKDYQGVISPHFFYLNVGTEGHPWPVRVEIPKWVADDKDKLDLLHAVLVDQCRMMGSKPYPYLLHRAHEVAVVKREEKYQVEQMLIQELRRQDEEMDVGSNKQSAKDLPGRTRR